MSLDVLLLGIFAILIGLAFVFAGFRFFLILLPIWGFFAGFIFGANVITQLFGDGFLATTTSWVAGFVVAIVFALLSYLYYWFAVVFLGGAIGYALGVGVMTWLGIGDGLLALIVGLIGAVIVALAFIVLRVPKWLVLISTAFGGAFSVITGAALILGRINMSDVAGGIVGSTSRADLGWLWVVAGVALGAVGLYYQWRATQRVEMAMFTDYMNPGMS